MNTEGGIDEHVIVEVIDGPGRREGRDGLEHAERVALLKELTEVTLVEGAGDEKHDVIDHVAIADVEIMSKIDMGENERLNAKNERRGGAPDVVEESAEGLETVGPHVLELLDELLGALLGNGGGVNGGGLILEEITVVRGRQVQLHVCVF